MTTAYNKNKNKGFTLIELLIVMAILGVLAVVVLVAINPVQQLARSRDSGRLSSVSQLGRALQAYSASSQTGLYPDAGTWYTSLTNTGELDNIPGEITNSLTTECSTNNNEGWCYVVDATNECAVVYSALEADNNIVGVCGTGTTDAWAAYDTCLGRGGITDTEPTAGNAGTNNYCN